MSILTSGPLKMGKIRCSKMSVPKKQKSLNNQEKGLPLSLFMYIDDACYTTPFLCTCQHVQVSPILIVFKKVFFKVTTRQKHVLSENYINP
jgi:hypothetical protein